MFAKASQGNYFKNVVYYEKVLKIGYIYYV